MKKIVLIAGLVLGMNNASASGFVCETLAQDLNVKVYNHTQASEGTRNGAIMILSDPTVSYGRKTIAKFKSSSLLTGSASEYTAYVDLRYVDSSRKGENIGGTKLGQLDEIILNVDFSYAETLAAGDEVSGVLTLVKRNGDEITHDMSCVRYLKN